MTTGESEATRRPQAYILVLSALLLVLCIGASIDTLILRSDFLLVFEFYYPPMAAAFSIAVGAGKSKGSIKLHSHTQMLPVSHMARQMGEV
jgi:hypothetical protein